MTGPDTSVPTDLSTWVVRAHKKLPDDLTISEYSRLVDALAVVCSVAEPGSSPRVVRSQYGSDFAVVVSLTASAATVMLTLSLAIKQLSAARKTAAEARKIVAEAELIRQQTAQARTEWELKHRRLSLQPADEPELRRAIAQLRARLDVAEERQRVAEDRAKRAIHDVRLEELSREERQRFRRNADTRFITDLNGLFEPGSYWPRRLRSSKHNARRDSSKALIAAIREIVSYSVELDVDETL